MSASRRLFVGGLALMGGALLGRADPLAGQIGALAAAAASAGAGGEYALAGAPVFAESGLVLTNGWSAGAFGVSTSTSFDASDGLNTFDAEYSTSSLSVGAFVAAGERAMVGAVLNPYVSNEVAVEGLSNTTSGLGNVTAIGKLALAESGPTRLAGTLSVELPTGDSDIVASTTTVAAGLGASRRLGPTVSLHGGASLGFTTDDGDTEIVDEGGTTVGFSGAVVKQLNPRAWLSGELLGSAASGEWQILLAPGARFRAGSRVFIDLGLAFGALSSDGVEPMDYGLAIGGTLVPGR